MRARQAIKQAVAESDSSCDLPSRSVNIVNMKKSSHVSIGSLKASRILGLSRLPDWRASKSSASSRPSRPKYRCRHNHRPQVTPFFDVDLKEAAHVVETRTPVPKPPLLLHRRGFGVALRDNEAAELVAKLSGHFLPDGAAVKVAKADGAIDHWVGGLPDGYQAVARIQSAPSPTGPR